MSKTEWPPNHKLDRYSIGFYLLGSAIFLHSVVMLTVANVGLEWFGVFLSGASVVVFWIGLLTKKKAVNGRVLMSLLAGLTVGLACVLYAGWAAQFQWLPMMYSILLASMGSVYVGNRLRMLAASRSLES